MATIVLPLSLRDAVPLPGQPPPVLTLNQSNGGNGGPSAPLAQFAFNSLVFTKTNQLMGVSWVVTDVTLGSTPAFALNVEFHSLVPEDVGTSPKSVVWSGGVGNLNNASLLTKSAGLSGGTNYTLPAGSAGVPAVGTAKFITFSMTPDGLGGGTNSFVVKFVRDMRTQFDTASEVRVHGVTLTYADA